MEKVTSKERLKHFDAYRGALDNFIGFKDVELVVDDNAETCSFYPTEKKVAIAGKWLKENQEAEDKDFEELKLKFGIFHEFSHYRDMIKEAAPEGNKSMIKILTEIGKRSIIVKDGGKAKKIPLGSIIHTLYNCIDDIVVNTEVGNYTKSEITWDDMESVYQKYLFADYKGDDKEKQSVIEIRDMITSRMQKKAELNLDEPVDYSKEPIHRALPFYFIRKYMVRNQSIILPPDLQSVLFNDNGKPRQWGDSFKKLKEIFEKRISEAKKGNPRYEMFKDKLTEHLNSLNTIIKSQPLKNVELKKALLDSLPDGTTIITSGGKKTKGIDKNITGSLSLEDIIKLFTITQGKDKDHRLVVSPDKRYEIIHKFFEPIQVTYILMELLDEDIKDEKNRNSNGGNGGEGESSGDAGQGGSNSGEGQESGDEKGEGNNGEEDKEAGKDKDDKKGKEEGEDDEEIGGEIGNRIRDLKDALNYQEEQEAKEKIKKQSQKSGKSLSDILQEHGFSVNEAEQAKNLLDTVIKNFSEEIKDFTEMLENELRKLEEKYEKEYFLSKKGNDVNYNSARKEIAKHIIDGDFEGARMFNKKRFKEELKDEFKKLVFYFMLDVSGSTAQFRGEEGYLNGIAMALASALHNVEQNIRDLLEDPSYTIPINFIVYANGAELIKCKYNSFDEMLAEANYKIITLDGGTDDVYGRQKSSEKVIEDFDSNESYVEDIENDKMKAVVLQIADLDVTEYGVKEFRERLKEKYGDNANQILKGIETKRLILGEKHDVERFLSEEEIKKIEGEFKPTIIYDSETNQPILDENGNIRVKYNEIGVKRKSEISDNVKKLFENLFIDTMKKK